MMVGLGIVIALEDDLGSIPAVMARPQRGVGHDQHQRPDF